MASEQKKEETDFSETMTERELEDMLSKEVKPTDSKAASCLETSWPLHKERLDQFVRWRIQEYTLHKWEWWKWLSEFFAEEFRLFVKEDFEKLSKDNIRGLRDCLRTNGVYVQKGRGISIAQALANVVQEDIPWPPDDEERPPPKQSQSCPPQQQPVQQPIQQQPYQPENTAPLPSQAPYQSESTAPILPPPAPKQPENTAPILPPPAPKQPENTTSILPPPGHDYQKSTSLQGKSITPPKSGLSALLPAETPAVETEFPTPACPATPPPEYRSTTPPPMYQSSTPKNYLTVADLYMRYAPLKSAKSSWIRPVITRSRTVLPILTVKDLYEKFHGKPKKNPAISAIKWTPASSIKYPKTNAATSFPGQESTARAIITQHQSTPVPTKHKTLVNICLDSAQSPQAIDKVEWKDIG